MRDVEIEGTPASVRDFYRLLDLGRQEEIEPLLAKARADCGGHRGLHLIPRCLAGDGPRPARRRSRHTNGVQSATPPSLPIRRATRLRLRRRSGPFPSL